MARLAGKTAIVTGAANGIGRSTAELFAEEGAIVIALDIDLRVNELEGFTAGEGRILARTGDVADEAFIIATIDLAVRELGGLDIFFANAAISGPRLSIWEQSVGDWQNVLRIDLVSVFIAVKHASKAMAAAGKGSIICTSSIAGILAYGLAPYSAAKAGVMALVRSATHELSGLNVRVNAIAPGVIESALTASHYERFRETGEAHPVLKVSPLGRGGSARELANAALFLASDESSYVNGHTMVVDGGWIARAQQPETGAYLDKSKMPGTLGLPPIKTPG